MHSASRAQSADVPGLAAERGAHHVSPTHTCNCVRARVSMVWRLARKRPRIVARRWGNCSQAVSNALRLVRGHREAGVFGRLRKWRMPAPLRSPGISGGSTIEAAVLPLNGMLRGKRRRFPFDPPYSAASGALKLLL